MSGPQERLGDERPSLARRLLGGWPYALVTFLYFATWPFHHGLNNPNEMVRVYMTRAEVLHGSPVIDPVIREWGGVDDKAVRDGKLYSSKAPLQSLVGVPIYRWLIGEASQLDKRLITTRLRRFGSVLPGLLFAGVLIAWSRHRARELGARGGSGTALGLTLALGTMLYPYALTFTGHIWAALSAGGAYLGVVLLSRATPGMTGWRALALITGFLGALAPFAEYPAALLALPALLGGLWVTRGWRRRGELAGLLALGGALPFAIGLWAHQQSWGSPFKTGYSFLENTAYVAVHHGGFFGVGAPKLVAFAGALFSPGTGLFFYSPVLVIGLVSAIVLAIQGRLRAQDEISLPSEGASAAPPIDRRLALAALIGCGAEFLFIAGHAGWRGGWTVGPRYIIAVAPVLGLWVIEAMRWQWARRAVPLLAAASIAITAPAAALYPHLSDVYTNPIVTFLWPSYARGESSYGLAHSLGLHGHAANAAHLVPIALAVLYAGLAGSLSSVREALWAALRLVLGLALIALLMTRISEQDAGAAARENERLWGFWEPHRPAETPPGLLFRARDRWQTIRVESVSPEGVVRPCTTTPGESDRCSYADQPWQHFAPETLELDGARRPILFLHPVQGWVVRATIPLDPRTRRAVLRYGLADASVASTNTTPVEITVAQRARTLSQAQATNVRGLQALELPLTSTAPLTLELRSANDGARVFGFDLELYAE